MLLRIIHSNVFTILNITGLLEADVVDLINDETPKVLLYAGDKWAIVREDLIEPLIANLIELMEG